MPPNQPRRLALAAVLLMLALVPDRAAASGDDIAALLAMQSIEERVVSVGHRLAASAGDLCPDAAPLSGLQLHDASQYQRDQADDLAIAFGLGPWPKLLAVAKGSAAERAGLRANDSILTIDGAMPPPEGTRDQSYGRIGAVLAQLDAALVDGKVALGIERDGAAQAIDLLADRGCASRFQLKVTDSLQGKADGNYVEVTSGLVAFAADDAELAAAIAHEMAHNILRHRARLDAQGMSRGIFQKFGRNARLMRETEVEADRFSVYLLDRAGYDLAAAPRFWKRFGKARGGAFKDATHPGAKTRVANIEAEIAAIVAAKARGEVPEFVPG